MKKLLLLFLCLYGSILIQAQVSKTVNVDTAGGLYLTLSKIEKDSVTNLTITGIVDARDFVTMKDSFPNLSVLDLSTVTINAYSGILGTEHPNNHSYFSNTLPDNSFNRFKKLKAITLPQSITTIGSATFDYCSGLSFIEIPSKVSSIGWYSFNLCSAMFTVDSNNQHFASSDGVLFSKNLDTLICCPISKKGNYTIPNSVNFINDYAFEYCSLLTTISLPSSITAIGISTFSGCTALQSFVIPSSVIYIGSDAFSNCSSLTSLTIPSSVMSIGDEAFSYLSCPITVDVNNQYFSGIDGVLFNKNEDKLIQCTLSQSRVYSIPTSVTTIGNYAFLGCKNLSIIAIPPSVTSIGNHAFLNCSLLTTITLPTSDSLIGYEAFYYCKKLQSIYCESKIPANVKINQRIFVGVDTINCILYVPIGSKTAYETAPVWKSFQHIVESAYLETQYLKETNLLLSPNPAKTSFSTNNIGLAQVTVYNTNGTVVIRKSISDNENIDIAILPAGLYYVTITTANGLVTKPLVVE